MLSSKAANMQHTGRNREHVFGKDNESGLTSRAKFLYQPHVAQAAHSASLQLARLCHDFSERMARAAGATGD